MNAIPSIDFPALCEEMHVTEREGVPVVNSWYVASTFERRHDHVLRDINEIKTSPILGECLGTSWFLATVRRDAYDREQPTFDLTRQGLTLLCMGWTGDRAMSFKVKYIQAFDAMEKALTYARDNLAAGFNDPVRLYSILRQLADIDKLRRSPEISGDLWFREARADMAGSQTTIRLRFTRPSNSGHIVAASPA